MPVTMAGRPVADEDRGVAQAHIVAHVNQVGDSAARLAPAASHGDGVQPSAPRGAMLPRAVLPPTLSAIARRSIVRISPATMTTIVRCDEMPLSVTCADASSSIRQIGIPATGIKSKLSRGFQWEFSIHY